MIEKQPVSMAFSYAPELRPAFVAHMASRLDALICAQTKKVLDASGVETPVRSVSIMMRLLRRGPASIADIARIEGQSHQLVSSRVAPLEKAGLVRVKPDSQDERRKLLSLTSKGVADARKVEKICGNIAAAFSDLNKELGVDLMATLEHSEQALQREPIAMRISPPPKGKQRKTYAHAG